MAGEMTKILTYIDQLKEVDTAGFSEREHVRATPLREDELRATLDRERVAGNAPEWSEGFFVVPRVIGGE
jgi:aspartyl/glutamyl-tRNA(Asn/Gln) amidotransferase C subunit